MAKLKKREDGRYQKYFTYNGKRYCVYASSQKELDEKIRQKIDALKSVKEEHDNPTFDAYYETFTALRRSKVKESTIRNQTKWYNCVSGVKVSGTIFCELRMRDIRPADMKQVQQQLIDSGKLSSTSINDCLAHISHVFAEAVNDETIDRNPCRVLKPVKHTEKKARDTKHRALSVEETKEFIRIATERNSFFLNAFKLMLNTGIRMGELGALRASDFDFKTGFLNINKTVSRDESGAYVVNQTPKTETSTRSILMNDTIIDIFNAQKKLVHELFGMKYTATLFPSPEGLLLRDYTFNREISRICKKMEIEPITSHALRATFATRFIEQRPQDYKVLSEILGHSDVKITLNLYTHVMEETKQQAMKELKIVM